MRKSVYSHFHSQGMAYPDITDTFAGLYFLFITLLHQPLCGLLLRFSIYFPHLPICFPPPCFSSSTIIQSPSWASLWVVPTKFPSDPLLLNPKALDRLAMLSCSTGSDAYGLQEARLPLCFWETTTPAFLQCLHHFWKEVATFLFLPGRTNEFPSLHLLYL